VAQGPLVRGGLALIIFGLFFSLVGAAAWAACSSQPTINGIMPNCGGLAAFTAIGIVLLVVGIILAVAGAASSPKTIYPTTDPAVPPPLIQPVVVQQTVVQQTVEVRCRYCGSLNPVSATKCAACGAAM
jgi:ribosomal protein L40E